MTERRLRVPTPHPPMAPPRHVPQSDPRHGPPQPALRSNPAIPAPAPTPPRHLATFQEPPSHAPPGAPLFGPARPQAARDGGGRSRRPRRWPWIVGILVAFLLGLAIPTGGGGVLPIGASAPSVEEYSGVPRCRITYGDGAVVDEQTGPGQPANSSCTVT